MKNSIALIGFMGVGKTVVGKALAEKLNKKFVELDYLIEQQACKTIPEIFEQAGEITFRELEIEIIKEVAGGKNQVIACGGGVVLNRINIDRLKENAILILLTASPEVLLRRAGQDGEVRPLLNRPDRESAVKELLAYREPLYKKAADITIDTSLIDIEAASDEAVKALKQYESTHR